MCIYIYIDIYIYSAFLVEIKTIYKMHDTYIKRHSCICRCLFDRVLLVHGYEQVKVHCTCYCTAWRILIWFEG
jgi:hypothetical protein